VQSGIKIGCGGKFVDHQSRGNFSAFLGLMVRYLHSSPLARNYALFWGSADQ
jgi:hypothetical protein